MCRFNTHITYYTPYTPYTIYLTPYSFPYKRLIVRRKKEVLTTMPERDEFGNVVHAQNNELRGMASIFILAYPIQPFRPYTHARTEHAPFTLYHNRSRLHHYLHHTP
ncbi:hypothetical protein EON63_16345 [archaeon]|nr:MAG: hypothetical protein EON63_16345 [archaeon]